MANKGKSKNKKNNKYAAAQKEKLSASDFFVGFGKWETISFCVGLLIGVVALFMLVAFVSYLFTGEADYSLLESHTDPLNSGLHYKNVCGSWGAIVAFFFLNDLFGLASFIMIPYLIILAMRMMRIFKFTLIRKFILFTVLMLWTSVFLSAFGYLFPYFEGSFVKLGGNHGIQVVKFLTQLVGTPGLLAVLVVTAVLYLIYLSAKTIEVIRDLFRLNFLKKMSPERWKRLVNKDEDDDDEEEDEEDESSDEVIGQQTPEETVEVVFPVEGRIDEPDENDENEGKDEAEEDELEDEKNARGESEGKGKKDDGTKMDIEANETEKGSGKIDRGDINTPYDPKLDLEHYKYPTLNLLRKADDQGPQIDMFEQNANKNRIIEVLRQFGVEIKSIKATIGPTITLYEIVPSEGTRISKIRNLEDDIALSLAAEGIRIIAPIPGKGTIGIEVPNKKKCIVSMESVINSRTYQESKMELPCAVGKTISNEVFMFDLAKAPHLLVAGATGQGKSVGLNAIVTSLLYKKHPSELKIVMVDPKKVEFSIYSPIENHFLARLEEEEDCIITDVQKVVKTLNSLCVLMDTRYDLLKRAHARTIKEYNEMFKARRLNPEHGHEYMPYIVVIVDEFGDLIMTAGKEVELPICRIAQLARAVGIHMIIATQRPQASIISGAIKANFPTRIAFKVSSMMDSRVILDRAGANQLIGKGDMLYLGSAEPVRVQCAFVDTPEVNDICAYIAKQQSFMHPMYLPEVVDPEGDAAGGMGTVDKGHLDPMFADVAKFVVNNQSGSTSMIQRNYSIGYNRAGKIMDQLERMGVVGPQVGAKPREVLIKDPITLDSLLNTL
ncbi:MAG: DNA translocase FtsK 4TM domain-containing protein [Bacteroidaceae bacterium]|nr:DNA translocase FtsK 4TM domain-containing protein [Bacteroidaceae bacterium]